MRRSFNLKVSGISHAFKTQVVDGELNLASRNMGDSAINEIINGIKTTEGLKSVDLSGNKITDEGIADLAKAVCESNVEELDLANNKLTEKCVDTLVAILKTKKTLKVLNLEGNGITNRVAKNKLLNTLFWVETKL